MEVIKTTRGIGELMVTFGSNRFFPTRTQQNDYRNISANITKRNESLSLKDEK